MAPQKRTVLRTLRDLEDEAMSKSASNPNKIYQSHNRDIQIAHIPNLHEATRAKSLLERIRKEFLPILQKRGYPVSSVSEMCCCGDGLDFLPNRRNKKRIMGSNVLGYNQTLFYHGKTHTIHLRLRQHSDHDVFYDYEHIAGTMSHELAHCEIGAHNAAFYKLMDEIQDQHAIFLTRGIVADSQGFPMGSQQAYVLGGGRNGFVGQRHSAARAAQERQARNRWMPHGPQRLGGTSEFQQWLLPREAAGVAAETRRLQDEVWCQPCEPEIIELSDDENGAPPAAADDAAAAQSSHDGMPPARSDLFDDQKLPAKNIVLHDKENPLGSLNQSTNSGIVDAINVREDHVASDTPVAAAARKPSPSRIVDLTVDDEEDEVIRSRFRPPKQPRHSLWTCPVCTVMNPGLALACTVCGAQLVEDSHSMLIAQQLDNCEKKRADKESRLVALQLHREQSMEQTKDQEVEQSVRDFGFNIYGNDKQRTSTMQHLT